MNIGETKEVYFSIYCHQCKYKDTKHTDEPCNDCLAHPSNAWSHKPVHFEEEEK